MRAPRRWMVAVLVPAGTIAGHALGYLLAGEDAGLSGAHSHLHPAAWLAAGLVAVALARAALVAPGTEGGRSRLPWLASAQVILFGALEAAEHLGAGHGLGSLLGERSFQWGVAAQLVTATLLLAATGLARVSGERVRELLHRSPKAGRRRRRQPWDLLLVALRQRLLVSSVSERGPPGLVAPA